MQTPAPPTPPNPQAVANTQTSSNIGTAIANTVLGNANTYGPYGSVVTKQSGTQTIQVPQYDSLGNPTGKYTSLDVPSYDQTTTLSPDQQTMLGLQNKTGISLYNTALNSSNQISDSLSHPVTAADLPSIQNGNLPAAQFTNLPNGPQFQLPSYTQQTGPTGAPVSSVPTAQAQQGYSYQTVPGSTGGPIQSQIGNAGGIQTGLGNAGGIQTGLGPSGQIQTSAGPGNYTQDAQNVQSAIMAREQPILDYNKDRLNTQLVNQGLSPGSEAYNQAMDQFNRQSNDASQQAVLAGYSEQQNLANLALQQGQFANTAQQQGYNQNLGSGTFGNTAQAQNFNQLALSGQFGNAAQQQAYNQLLSGAQFGNTAQQQAYTQQTGTIGQNNAANLAAAQFGNAAVGQNNAANLAAGQFANAAGAQGFNQQQSQLGFNNALATQGAQNYNNAAQQGFTNTGTQAGVANQNAQQIYSNMLSSGQFSNAAEAQAYAQALGLQQAPINEITGLLNGTQIQTPGGQYQGGQVATTPVGSYVYDTASLNQANYNTQVAVQNAALGGIAGLGGTLGAAALKYGQFSDRRLKRDIADTGLRLVNGLALYTFRYVGDALMRFGLMADDVRQINPRAVFTVGGFDAVDYNVALA